jgi:lipopolysaccharide/colanic/teichoic acid biosynthesis glycosyltransferase
MEAHQLLENETWVSSAAVRRQAGLAPTIRRAFDLVASMTLLVILSPLLLAIAIAIRLDSRGPVIFRQRRLGRDGMPFTVRKFRTMRSGADAAPHREYVRALIEQGGEELAQSEGGRHKLYKLAVDDRITSIGRTLRRLSLDELPQLWNVLRGDMSLVGPRPVIPYEAERYPTSWWERFAVKPGITGLWQVSGRNERSYSEMVGFDIEYARSQSLRLDAVILVKTLWVVVRGKGAA